MPTVQTYQSDQVRTQVAGRTQASTSASGLEDVGRGLGALANTTATIAQRQEQERAVALELAEANRLKASQEEARQSVTEFERAKNELFFNPEKGYFNTQGRNAFEGADAATKQLGELKKQYAESLNPIARQEFDRVADAHITRGISDIQRHSSSNMKAWQQANIEAQVENTLENSSLYWNDEKQLNVQRVLGRTSVLEAAQLQGASPEVTKEKLQNYESAFAMNTISAATSSSADAGDAAMEKYGSKLEGPDKVKLDNALTAKRKSEETQKLASEAVIRSGNLIEMYGDRPDARAAILEQVNSIEDTELRKAVMSESTHQLQLKLQADAEERGNIFEEAEKMLYQGQSMEQLKAINPNAWNKLSPKQQQALLSSTSVKTDYVLFSELSLMSKDELAKVNPSDYFPRLAATERKQLITMVGAARKPDSDDVNQIGRTRAAQTSFSVEQLFGKKANWNDDKKAQVNAFYGAIDSEARMRAEQKGAPLSSQEYTDMLNQMTRKVVIEGTFWDSEKDLSDIPAVDLRDAADYLRTRNESATAESLQETQKGLKLAAEHLRKNGKPATVENIRALYDQARR